MGLFKQQNNPHEWRVQMPDIYLPVPHLFVPNHCEYIIAALPEKGVSAWFYTWTIKEIFDSCVLNNSTVCCASFLLTVRKMSSVWQDHHLSMAGHKTFQECSALFSTSAQQDSVWEADEYGEASSGLTLKGETQLDVPRCVPRC